MFDYKLQFNSMITQPAKSFPCPCGLWSNSFYGGSSIIRALRDGWISPVGLYYLIKTVTFKILNREQEGTSNLGAATDFARDAPVLNQPLALATLHCIRNRNVCTDSATRWLGYQDMCCLL